MYAGVQDVAVGPVEVDSVQLCSMARGARGYYPVVASLCLHGGEVIVGEQWAVRFGQWQERCRTEYEQVLGDDTLMK